MTNTRFANLQAALRAAGLDAVAVVPGANLRYLAGLELHSSERLSVVLLSAQGTPAAVLPRLEQPRAEAQAAFALDFHPWTDAEGPTAALAACAAALGLAGARVGVEYTAMRVLELRGLEAAAPGITIVDATPIFAELRMVKDTDELAAMRAAVQVIEAALREAIAQVRVGMTERELADIWNGAIASRGSSPSFETIIASGPNSANPHHTSGDRAFQPGDLIVMDGGAWYGGYCSDITRTIAVGEPSPEARRIYEVVKLANAVGRAACAPGASGDMIDTAAREVIEDSGYGPQFVHRTGHGLGMEVHEPPYIVGGNTAPLPVSATFTVEPGVYVAGTAGVRIEDNIVITADGAESLTTFDRDLIVVHG